MLWEFDVPEGAADLEEGVGYGEVMRRYMGWRDVVGAHDGCWWR